MVMQSFVNASNAVKRRSKTLLLVLGALQVATGATVTVAPYLATVLGPRPFAIAMIVTGVVSTVLGFVVSQLKGQEE